MHFADVTTDDLETLADLIKSFYDEDPVLPDFDREEAERRAAKLIALSPDPVCPMFVCDAERIVGYAVIVFYYSNEYNGYLAMLDEFFITSGSRGRGIGGEALERLKLWAMDRGCRGLTLEVLDGNDKARQLYERHGFAAPERRTLAWFPR